MNVKSHGKSSLSSTFRELTPVDWWTGGLVDWWTGGLVEIEKFSVDLFKEADKEYLDYYLLHAGGCTSVASSH
jgi:hypothetical protein